MGSGKLMEDHKYQVKIGETAVGDECPCLVIAEIGANYNGSLELAKESIDAAIECGADVVKFQTYRAEEFLASKSLQHTYQVLSGEWVSESQYEMFKRLELSIEWHKTLQDYAQQKGTIFLSSAADKQAVDLLEKLNVPALKFASEDLINVDLLEYSVTKKLPVVLSTGMASEEEIDIAVNLLRNKKLNQLILLHCTSLYPTPLPSANLRRITSLRQKYGFPVGYSDHTEGHVAAVGAVALGACIIEKHFTLDRGLPGPDHKMSADPSIFREMVDNIRQMELMRGIGGLDFDVVETQARIDFRRSIVASMDLKAGQILTREMLAFKRPATGLKPHQAEQLTGGKLSRDLNKNECILMNDVSLKFD